MIEGLEAARGATGKRPFLIYDADDNAAAVVVSGRAFEFDDKKIRLRDRIQLLRASTHARFHCVSSNGI
jgi:hypothetical protein